jgi:hypothetical protein
MTTQILRIAAIVAMTITLATSVARAHEPGEAMAAAAQRFVASLDDGQRELAVYELAADERHNWHFVPNGAIQPERTRHGLPLNQMNGGQQALAHALVAAGLSHKGYLAAMTVMSLEQVLHELENQSPTRDPTLYYVAIFGAPGGDTTWGWRFEGHHLSVNFTIVDGHLFSVTPTFFGTNPATVRQGPRRGLQTLAAEEQLARELVTSLSEEQREQAIISADAPQDIITGDQRSVDRGAFMPTEGIAGSNLNEQQQQQLQTLVRAYAEKFRPEIVDEIAARTDLFNTSAMHFAWAGGTEAGEGHYYRVQTEKFLFEYDNTQNNANHVHAVWRDFDGDFGVDLLREHYDESHAE